MENITYAVGVMYLNVVLNITFVKVKVTSVELLLNTSSVAPHQLPRLCDITRHHRVTHL